MPLPEDESSWGNLDVMFATTGGTVRRNKLSDFVDVRRSGIIAMKLGEGEAIVDVQICTERDDVLLTAAGGQCIRFPVTDVRVFTGRTSMGVRGIALAENDTLISLAILRHVETTRTNGRPTSRCAARWPARRAEEEPADAERGDDGRSSSLRSAMRNVGAGAGGADGVRQRLRQAHLVLRVPHHRPRRQRHRRDERQQPQRQAGGVVPGRAQRPDHAGDRQGPADPLPGRGHPHRRPLDAGVIVFDTAEDEHVVSVEHIGDDGENGENGNGG
jgi:DNA gyrase subunit A